MNPSEIACPPLYFARQKRWIAFVICGQLYLMAVLLIVAALLVPEIVVLPIGAMFWLVCIAWIRSARRKTPPPPTVATSAVPGGGPQLTRIAVGVGTVLFFLASCTTTAILVTEPSKTYVGMRAAGGAEPRMVVVASVPDPDKPGHRKLTPVHFFGLEEFQSKQPDHTFVIPPGSGTIQDVNLNTSYQIMLRGDGRVAVETTSDFDVPPFGMLVYARYEATDRQVTPVYSNVTSPFVPLVVGLVVASVLTGILKVWMRRRVRR